MASKGESTKTEIKKEVKIVKKQVKKEQKNENQNGDQNGDADIEAELTVKLPTKKSGAKTETKVEVVKKILPDGSVQEIKTTTTKTTIDGKTEITTKTETKTIPKEEDEEEEVVEEEEEEEENGEVVVEEVQDEKDEEELIEEPKSSKIVKESSIKENGHESNIVKTEERSETTTTKKVVVQNTTEEEPEEEVEEEEDIVEEAEPVTVVIKKPIETTTVQEDTNEVEEEETEEVEEKVVDKEEEIKKAKVEEIQTIKQEAEEEEEVEEEEVEEDEEEEVEVKKEDNIQEKNEPAQKDDEEEVEEEEEVKEDVDQENVAKTEENKSQSHEKPKKEDEEVEEVVQEKEEKSVENAEEEPEIPSKEEKVVQITVEKEDPVQVKQIPTIEAPTAAPQVEYNIPLREPSIPLDKVEDVEIKPIGLPSATISKSHTENTEIITSTSPYGPLSTQTEYNKIENIVTVNRTTKILDHSYENLTQQGIPTVKTYFPPSSKDRVLASPLPSRPYQPVYPPEPQTERRHSLLLERLSMERQLPEINQNNYQYTNQAYEEQRQFSQEPQSEVLTVSNVKPSAIKNQDWFQQSRRENVIYNNLTPSTPAPPPPTTPLWSQQQTRPQPQPQPQPPVQQYVPPQPQYQPSFTETIAQDRSNSYQQNTYQENTYTPYTPKPTWGSNVINVDPLPSINTPSPHPYVSKDTTDSYQSSTQKYSSSYVPPPWEQDSSYVVDNSNQNYYQNPPPTTTYTPTQSQSWKPAPVSNKYTKPAPTAYIPPAPNQSFVVPVTNVEPPRLPGRKTYYSEYERRYISVPEATYIPGETKYQPQPDPSPQYYYDNNEPNEVVEHEWRKELREFTEKSTKIEQKIEQTNVNPPWEAEAKYAKTLPTTYTATPTWSQTVRPRSWRERSYDAEYIGSQEWPTKTNTLGRGRPLSSTYGKTNIDAPIPERTRGVSVDRYNPNNYQSPIAAEHPPVQSHTLTTPAPNATYHNPNVPSYHARASAEPRGQPVYPQARTYREPQPSPFQSRSFKYLQWITGTED